MSHVMRKPCFCLWKRHADQLQRDLTADQHLYLSWLKTIEKFSYDRAHTWSLSDRNITVIGFLFLSNTGLEVTCIKLFDK